MAVSTTWSELKAEGATPRPLNPALKESIHYSSPAPRSRNSFDRLFFTPLLSSPSSPSSFTNTQYSLSPSHLSDNYTRSSSPLRHLPHITLVMVQCCWLLMRLISSGTNQHRQHPVGMMC
ncbi:hypothetical protein E2C01_030825 [Portunus trituberculatus]|uniref:Uncharacterized protein n=1 Tax=Portunus trituberculatus TaxID=210409 RepID=A0A5B7ES22_PORTR|nr:hypothetical protein [Portunus trituberculatus]